MTSASLSVLDPSLIDGIRNQLADDYARRIFDAIPEISDCLEFEAEACNNATGKQRFRRASQLLYSRGRDLQSQTAAVVRRTFEEKLFRLLDATGGGARRSLDSMTLLADERLDEEIAVNHCSRRLKEQCEYELWGLTRRIAIVTGLNHPADSQNPVFTHIFSQALMEAIGSLETDAGVRLVVFKAFGPALLEIVPASYVAANAALTARGIDVESAEYYGRPVLTAERQAAPLPTPQEIALGAAQVNLELTSALRQILSGSAGAPPTVQPDATTAPARQDGLRDREAGTTGQAPDSRPLRAASLSPQDKLTRDEQLIGDIVTGMFERLLTDSRMPAQLRESVARLQVPVLELALKDRSLLTQVHHPVRKLVDLIAEFGLTIGPSESDDSTARTVSSIIDGMLQIRDTEPNAFKLAFDRLDSLFYHHEEAALQTDDELRALERAEAGEFAGNQADREIALRLQNRTLPAAISAFIVGAWRDVLIHAYLNGGPKGEPWRLALSTLDDTLRSLSPSTDQVERQRLAKILPAFIELLLDTADCADDRQVLATNFFAALDRAQELASAGKCAEIGGERFTPSPVALAASTVAASPSAALAAMGLACGDWIETRDAAGTRRWRLNWITTIQGTCVFKHYETNTTRTMRCDELRALLASGEVQQVRGLGLADEVLNGAFETVSRKARRDEAALAVHAHSAASRSVSLPDALPRRGAAA